MNRRRMLAYVIVISGVMTAVAVALSASTGFSPPEPTQDVPAKTLSDTTYLDPIISREAIMRHNVFAIDMYKQIAEDPNQDELNVFFSPFSIYMAFSFLYEGARAETATEMERVFGFYSDTKTRHKHVSQTISSINRDDPHATLETANALWLDRGFVPYDTYTNIVRDTYLADIETLDFRGDPEGSAKQINDWAADKTNDKIKNVVNKHGIIPVPTAVLNNAIYFKGTWITQFDPINTQTDEFWKTNTTKGDADFMNNRAFFNYTESDGVQILQMPYEGDRLSMLVFLPSEKNGILQLENAISAETINAWLNHLQPTDVVVSMPTFKAETDYSLVDYLVNLGMSSAFGSRSADFSGIIDLASLPDNLFVSGAYHNAFVDVNEEGTEAAAVTTIVTSSESAKPKPVQFTANHPFIFAIQDDESGTILFLGRLSDPTL